MKNLIYLLLLAIYLFAVGAQARTFNATESISIIPASGTELYIKTDSASSSLPLKLDANDAVISGQIDLTSEVTGVLPPANGGLGTFGNTRILFTDGSGTVSDSPNLLFDESSDPTLSLDGELDLVNNGLLRFYESGGSDFVRIEAPGALAASYSLVLPADDGDANQVLETDGSGNLSWVDQTGGGGGSVTGVEIEKTQATHGFASLTAIYHNGTQWTEAQADDSSTLAEYVVTAVLDANTFKAAKFGEFSLTHGLTQDAHFFLSATSAGDATTTEPPLYSAPLFYTEGAGTVHIGVYRPSVATQIGVASGSQTYEFKVGNASDVVEGSASFDSLQTAINFATAGNLIKLLPRTFTENITVNKQVSIVGLGNGSVIDGTVDFSVDASSMERLKVDGDITVNAGTKNVILAPTVWVTAGSVVSGNGATNSFNEFTEN